LRSSRWFAAVLVAMSLLLGACGEEETPPPAGQGGTASDGHSHSHDGFQFGEPADTADATTKVEVVARDFEFDPKEITVEQGDIVEFVVTNEGSADHEFVIGDAALMDELGSMAHQHGADDPYAVPVMSSGDEGSLTWNFTQPGRFRFECHVDEHNELGMTGTITVMGN